MSDFVLDITVKQRAWVGIRARIHPEVLQHSVQGIERRCTSRLWVLVINLVQGTTTNVLEIAHNQVIVVGRYTTTWWLPENSIDIHCTGHDRATLVRDVAAGAGCSRKLSVALVRKDMNLMGLGSSGRWCRKAGCRHQR